MTGKQRSYLKKLAHELEPCVWIGRAGLTDSVLASISDALSARELVKVSIGEGAGLNTKETCQKAADILSAEFVQAIGRRFVLYRQAPKKENRKIVLPR